MADALTVSPEGMFWQSASKPIGVHIYGEFTVSGKRDPELQRQGDIDEDAELKFQDYWRLYHEGKWQSAVASRSGVPALQKYLDTQYPHNATGIPDLIRSDEFLREFHDFEQNRNLPNLLVITLPNDHTNGTDPNAPTPRAMVAQNDLALGRIVEGISKSQYWAKSLIFVVEDDAQNGLDHVDGHRTIALAIGPHIRRGAVDSNHYNHTSMIRTIQDIFQIPPKTRFLASARSMHSIFTDSADLTRYQSVPNKIALDEMNPPLKSLNGRQLWAARQSRAMNWSEPDDVPEDTLNRILWWDSKGYNK